jgi:signal transduction histidine kinase
MNHDLEHQLRNLLSIIIGYANLLEESMPADDLRHADLREIMQAAQQAIDLLAGGTPRE